jgi:hypothetical protein
MGFRRRARRRGLIAGGIAGAAIARHHANAQQADEYEEEPQYAPPPADPSDQLEHLAQLHASGALTDEEFASAKAKVLGS